MDHINQIRMFRKWSKSTAMDIGDISFTIPDEGLNLTKPTKEIWYVFLSGAFSGIVSRSATAPFDRLKTIMQASTNASSSGIMNGLREIYVSGGWRAFFQGNGANVIKVAPESAMKFITFEKLKSIVPESRLFRDSCNNDPGMTIVEKLVAGGAAGIASQSFVYPLEIAKTRMSVAKKGTYKGIIDCIKGVCSKEGPLGLYRGWLPSVIGIVPYAGVDLALYTTLKEHFMTSENPHPLTTLGCGAVSSTCGQVVS
jgi:solute carrier family 25 phosphate transporter 23/24/25/41